MKPETQEKKYWLDEKRNVSKVFYALCVICAALFAADLFYHKHESTEWDGLFGFYAWYGFIGSVFLVLSAKQLRRILKRREDYYD